MRNILPADRCQSTRRICAILHVCLRLNRVSSATMVDTMDEGITLHHVNEACETDAVLDHRFVTTANVLHGQQDIQRSRLLI